MNFTNEVDNFNNIFSKLSIRENKLQETEQEINNILGEGL